MDRVVGDRRAGDEVVVVGSGPNGLSAALSMAKAGRRVTVLEAADVAGGGLRSHELTLPGFVHDYCATVLGVTLVSPAFRTLDWGRLGVTFRHPEITYAQPQDDGPAAVAYRSLDATAAGLGVDGPAWRRLLGRFVGHGDRLFDALLDPLRLPPRHPLVLAGFGPLALLPARPTARRAFRTERARALFAGVAAHSVMDLDKPMTAGVGAVLAISAHHVGWPLAAGGSQVVADALVTELRSLGGEVVTGHTVRTLGELPAAATVFLDVSARQLLAMDTRGELPGRYRAALAKYRYGPGVVKVDWALDGPVPWRDPEVAKAGTVHLAGSLDETAEAEKAVSRGRHPERPYVLAVQPGAADPSRAPEGKQTFWAYTHVPHGSDRDVSEQMEAQVERFAPGFRDRVLARYVMTPSAIEAHNANNVGGDIGGGVADLRQFFFRPHVSLRPWVVPRPRTYLCSSSTPPSGGAHGMGGWIAARLALDADRAAGRRTG